MSKILGLESPLETKDRPDLPDCTVVNRWFDEDRSADAERTHNDRTDAYSVYMSSPSSKGAL